MGCGASHPPSPHLLSSFSLILAGVCICLDGSLQAVGDLSFLWRCQVSPPPSPSRAPPHPQQALNVICLWLFLHLFAGKAAGIIGVREAETEEEMKGGEERRRRMMNVQRRRDDRGGEGRGGERREGRRRDETRREAGRGLNGCIGGEHSAQKEFLERSRRD
eukprot:172287-Hanusia_phi.AAC.2